MSSENSLSFFGAGGHSHDGSNSTLIDTTRYSIFDFSLGYLGSQARINSQSVRQRSFEDYIVRIINSQVLQPAGLNLDPDTLNGKIIRANTITSTEIQARTITSEEIKAATITANELTSNIVLINNIIRSNNFNGTFHSNGVINNSGTTGWGISYAGSSVFNNATIRGRLTAGDIYIPSVASPVFSVASSGALTATSATITGVLNSAAGSTVGPLTVQSEQVFASWDNKIVSLYTNNTWGGGGTPDNWARIGLGVKDTGSALSLYTSRGAYIFSSDTPPFWPYDGVTSLTKGRLLIADTRGVFLTASATNGRLDFRSGSSGITSGWGRIEANVDFLIISRKEATSSGSIFKFVSVPQDSAVNELFNVGNPTPGASGSAWEVLTWNTTLGTLGRTASSIRYKENINSLPDVGHIIDQLRPVSFIMKRGNETSVESEIARLADVQYGFIAEEVAEIDNGHLSVFQPSDGELIPADWRMRDMIAILVKEVQGLRQRVSDLELLNGNLQA
jgi:hypothetical protein